MSALAIPAASAGVIAAIDRWHAFMRGDDATALDELLHDGDELLASGWVKPR